MRRLIYVYRVGGCSHVSADHPYEQMSRSIRDPTKTGDSALLAFMPECSHSSQWSAKWSCVIVMHSFRDTPLELDAQVRMLPEMRRVYTRTKINDTD